MDFVHIGPKIPFVDFRSGETFLKRELRPAWAVTESNELWLFGRAAAPPAELQAVISPYDATYLRSVASVHRRELRKLSGPRPTKLGTLIVKPAVANTMWQSGQLTLSDLERSTQRYVNGSPLLGMYARKAKLGFDVTFNYNLKRLWSFEVYNHPDGKEYILGPILM